VVSPGTSKIRGVQRASSAPGILDVRVDLPLLYVLATAIPSLAKLVRRLHDTNHSGWWVLISAVPFIGPLILFIYTVKDGDPGENSFGPDPKALVAADVPKMGYLAPPLS
jgi:uncharacterized membrane protein YhaH (DUF805 family)